MCVLRTFTLASLCYVLRTSWVWKDKRWATENKKKVAKNEKLYILPSMGMFELRRNLYVPDFP